MVWNDLVLRWQLGALSFVRPKRTAEMFRCRPLGCALVCCLGHYDVVDTVKTTYTSTAYSCDEKEEKDAFTEFVAGRDFGHVDFLTAASVAGDVTLVPDSAVSSMRSIAGSGNG